jgi:PKD repeat protein
MTIVADFSVSNKVGDNFNTVTFTDSSSGTITERQWILGDGTVIGGNLTVVKHTYVQPGEYDVTLVARDVLVNPVDQNAKTITDCVIVNEIRPTPSFIITQSFEHTTGAYWRFYLDTSFYLVFENNLYIYRSLDRVADISKWAFVAYDVISEKMYAGSFFNYLEEIEHIRTINSSPIGSYESFTEIATQSQMKIDELKIHGIEKDLFEYFKEARGRAGYLDLK